MRAIPVNTAQPMSIMMKVRSNEVKLPDICLLSIEKNDAASMDMSRKNTPFACITPLPVWFTDIRATPATEHTIHMSFLADRCSLRIKDDRTAVVIGMRERVRPEKDEVVYFTPYVSARK